MNDCQHAGIRLAALCAVLAVAGCVTTAPPPLTELALAKTAIEQADQAGAAEAAPIELSAARERLEQAERLASRDPDQARWAAQEAEADARLAEATAADAKARLAVAQLDKSLDAIKG